MVKVKNCSDQPQALWWGHTAYDINPGETIDLEPVIVEACLKHPDYRKMFQEGILEIVETGDAILPDIEASVPSQEPPGSSPPASPEGTQPWDGTDDWDPTTAPIAEVVDYCKAKGLKFDASITEIDLRQSVDEHYLSN